MRKIVIKDKVVESQELIPNETFMYYLEKFLEDNRSHLLFGTMFIANKRELMAYRTYELESGEIVIFDEGKSIVENGTLVEKTTKLSRAEKPSIEIRW